MLYATWELYLSLVFSVHQECKKLKRLTVRSLDWSLERGFESNLRFAYIEIYNEKIGWIQGKLNKKCSEMILFTCQSWAKFSIHTEKVQRLLEE